MHTSTSRRNDSTKLVTWLVCFLLAGPAAASGLQDENLLQPLLVGYVVGHQDKQSGLETIEYVPQGETVQNWTQMLTTQILRGRQDIPAGAYLQMMQGNWSKACPGSEATEITAGQENGYPFALWRFICPRNPGTGKPEYTWMKAIQGQDAFYLVQKAYKFDPGENEVVALMKQLQKVVVCDSRTESQACPKVKSKDKQVRR